MRWAAGVLLAAAALDSASAGGKDFPDPAVTECRKRIGKYVKGKCGGSIVKRYGGT